MNKLGEAFLLVFGNKKRGGNDLPNDVVIDIAMYNEQRIASGSFRMTWRFLSLMILRLGMYLGNGGLHCNSCQVFGRPQKMKKHLQLNERDMN